VTATPTEASNRFFEEVLNGHNLDVIDDLVSEDYVELDPSPGQGPGREGLRQTLAAFNQAFPDNQWHIDERYVLRDRVITRIHWTGTHTAPFQGIPATNKSASVNCVVFDEFENGRMARSRLLMDQFGLMQQLGLLPPMG
jgi:steroid delta-isomerase-like uncharacterized protein